MVAVVHCRKGKIMGKIAKKQKKKKKYIYFLNSSLSILDHIFALHSSNKRRDELARAHTLMLILCFFASSGSRFPVQQTLTSNESNFPFSD